MFRQQGLLLLKFLKHKHPFHQLQLLILFRCKECLNRLWATATCLRCQRLSIHTLLYHHLEAYLIQTNLAFHKLLVNSSYTFITILYSIYLFQLLGTQYYGTYPGTYAQQIQQGNYPHAGMNQQQDPNKPYGF